ncbi:hypothetical protein [Maribacter sp. 2-571]|uniref:hypothetical protein n=1 Tax=Maribacter sp. 2-571 TaxID=3417569 RepID=UPI003D32DD05
MTARNLKPLSLPNKFVLRFVFLYVLLYIYPYGFEYITEMNTDDFSFWKPPVIWFGEVFFGWEFDEDRLLNGFDSKYDFARFALVAFISVVGAAIWLFIDSKVKSEYNEKLKILLQTVLRYHIGLTLLLYGLSKVFLLQFGMMDIDSLETKIGDYNGMGYLWAFMSYSKFYGISAGLIEVAGGILVLFRKTTSLGAFLLLIAMLNVVLIDIGFDVTVKMFAIHLLLMTILLLWNDLKRLTHFFLKTRATTSANFLPLFTGKKGKKTGLILKAIVLCYVILSFGNDMSERIATQHTNRYKNLTGLHDIELFVKNGDTIPTDDTKGNRWDKMSIKGLSYLPETLLITKTDKNKGALQIHRGYPGKRN